MRTDLRAFMRDPRSAIFVFECDAATSMRAV